MTKFAPEIPTTIELEAIHATAFDPTEVMNMRERVSAILHAPASGLVVGAGPCSFTGDPAVLHEESTRLDEQTHDTTKNLVALQRRNFWKPRSNPEDWHGPETTDPEETYRRIVHGAMAHANGTAELASLDHVRRYGKFLTLGWFGARNSDIDEQIAIAQADPTLPLGYKNSVAGKLEEAVETVAKLNEARGKGAAPVVLIYRGGDDAKTPTTWEDQVKKALSLTNNAMILDLAHGGEQAHDLNGQFEKSKLGQVACALHAIKLAQQGLLTAGYLMEASAIDSLTDPNMPFEVAIETMKKLATMK